MRRLNIPVLAISLVIGLAAQATEPPFTGRFLGSGRACYGTLAVDAKTVSWLTSFSQCQAVPVELVERDDSGGALRVTYRFKTGSSSCRFGALSLSHDGTKNLNTGWQVVGYASEARFIEDKASGYALNAPDMMFCSLIRDPGKNAQSHRRPSQSTQPHSD
jgi:hypothetical protein